MAFRRYGIRRRFRRSNRSRRFARRPRRSRYLRKRRSSFGRRRNRGPLSKLMRALLPTVPIKYIETIGRHGITAARSWFSKSFGDVEDVYTYMDKLPGQSNIYDDGTIGTSTHLSFQQYGAKKMKFRHSATITAQNTGNTVMILTVHTARYRRDNTVLDQTGAGLNAIGNALYKDTSAPASGEYLIDKNSNVPTTSTITNYYDYPQFTMFYSTNACSIWKVLNTRKLRVPPGGWVKFKVSTGYKEFDKKWVNENHGLAAPLRYLGGWSKSLIFTWHGELVQKLDDVTTNTLSSTDLMMYITHSYTLKAVPYHRQSTIFLKPVTMSSGTTLGFTPQVRPTVIVQVTKTDQAAAEEAE